MSSIFVVIDLSFFDFLFYFLCNITDVFFLALIHGKVICQNAI